MSHHPCGKSYLPRARKQLLLFMILFLMLPLWAQHSVLRIEDPSGKPLANVKVSYSSQTLFSDDNGIVKIPKEAKSLHFSRLGYMDKLLNTTDIPQNMTIVLSVKAIEHPVIRVSELNHRSQTPALDTRMIHPDTNARAMASAEMLLSESSFASADNKLMGERQTVSLLGSLSRHTLVMLDGVALNSAGEAFDFSKIPPSQIERIEIIKGNASAYGGSSAIGGIVNIITKAPDRPDQAELGVTARAGSYDMLSQEYQLSYMKSRFGVFAQYQHYSAQNDFPYVAWWDPEGSYRRKHNAKTTENLYLKSSYGVGNHNLEYTLSTASFVRELPGPINYLELYDDSRMSGSNWFHTAQYTWAYKQILNELRAFYQSDRSSFRNLEPTNPQNISKYHQDQKNSGLQNSLSLVWDAANLDFLAEATRLRYDFTQFNLVNGEANTLRGDRQNLAFALRGAYKYILGPLDANSQLSLRNDITEGVSHPTWRAEQEISYLAGARIYLGGTLGTAYSLPSLYDMYWIGDSQTIGNPDLKSESSISYSIRAGAEHQLGGLNLALYHNEIDNLIQWRQIFLFGSRWQPFNVGSARIRNLELNGNWNLLKPLSLVGGVTFTEAKDFSLKADGSPSATYGKRLTYTPDLKINLSLKLADTTRSASLNWMHYGEQFSTIDNAIDPLPAYEVWNLDLMHKFQLGKLEAQIDCGLRNLLDKRYEIYAYTPQPGFNWQLGIGMRYTLH